MSKHFMQKLGRSNIEDSQAQKDDAEKKRIHKTKQQKLIRIAAGHLLVCGATGSYIQYSRTS